MNDEFNDSLEIIINDNVDNVFKARILLGINVTEEEKEILRKEIISENKILLGLGDALVQRRG